jgi:putative heme-binding domain-containing protein
MKRRAQLLFVAGLGLLGAAPLFAAERVPWTTSNIHGSPEPPAPYRVERAFPKLTFAAPLEAASIPGTDRLVVVEQRGRLFSLPNDEGCEKADLFAELRQFDAEVVECYSIAFHPRFHENRHAFVWVNLDLRGKPTREDGTRIVRFRVTEESPPRLDLPSGQTIFTWLGGGHNGGNLRFGPDGMLYISTGDSASPDPPDPLGTGQDITDVLASVLRIDVDRADPGKAYAIPQDNPFVSTPGARGEVWAYGFRNPWRMSFDRKTGALWLGDVGWELWEMIYRVQRGGNYGWSITEGGRQDVRPDRARGPTPILPPIAVHSHGEAASITGGEIYYGKRLPELAGAYIYGDWQFGTFWALRADGDGPVEPRELCRSTLMPAGFGVTPDGELLICDHAGGGLWRLARNPEAAISAPFPRRLSETGLFSEVVKQTPAPGVVPYSVNAERWADGATGERWIALPGSEVVSVAKRELGVMPAGRWVFPPGAVLAKTYSLEMEHGNAATSRRIETQLLHFDGQQWAAYDYRWNDAQTDAELVSSRGADATFEVKDSAAPGGVRRQTWRYFSRAECLRCHNLPANFAPGFNALQLDRSRSVDDPLDLIAPPGLAADEPKLVDPHGSPEVRARSYLHANCSVCHRFSGGGAVPSMMNVDTPLREAKLIGAKPVQGDLGLSEARIIAPGAPSRSVLLYRMATAGRGHMPYLGGKLVDDRGVVLMRDWIASLRGEEELPAVARQRRESEQNALTRLTSGDTAKLDDLLATASGALSVALGVIDGSLAGDVRKQVITKGSALADPLRRDLFERFLPEDQRRKVLGLDIRPEVILALHGETVRGKALFAALCATCHRAADAGADFGPDLTHVGTKFDRAKLLEQILDPTRLIDPPWELATVTFKSGETLTGFIFARTDADVTLKLAGGEKRKISALEFSKVTTEHVSLMPSGLLQSLTAQEAADLLEFVSSLK